MNKLENDVFLRALKRQPTDRTPIWVMRQAGRYLPEYRATRQSAGGFMDLCKNPELACEVTLQPLDRYRLDAAILFSDILTIPDAMGLGLYFETGEGTSTRCSTAYRASRVACMPACSGQAAGTSRRSPARPRTCSTRSRTGSARSTARD